MKGGGMPFVISPPSGKYPSEVEVRALQDYHA